MESSKKRSHYFDNAKFILIFLVVFGHVISPLKENNTILFTLYSFIFLFHMPAFILISGYFSKGFHKKGYFIKTVKKVLVPYLIFQIVYSIFYYVAGEERTLSIDLLQPHWTLWFLLSLFCWNVLLYVFARFKWVGFLIAVVLGIGIGYVDDVGSYLSLSRTFVFFPYFLLGFLVDSKHLKAVKKIKHSAFIGYTVLILTMLLFARFFPQDAIPWLLGDTPYTDLGANGFADGLIRASQYVVTVIVIYGFMAIVPTAGFTWTQIGQRTIYVYLLHGFIIKSIQALISDDTLVQMSDHVITLMIFSLGLCLLLGNYVIQKFTRPLIELTI